MCQPARGHTKWTILLKVQLNRSEYLISVNWPTTWYRVFLEKLLVTHRAKIFPTFMEPRGWSPCPQNSAIQHCPEPSEFRPHLHPLFLSDPFQYTVKPWCKVMWSELNILRDHTRGQLRVAVMLQASQGGVGIPRSGLIVISWLSRIGIKVIQGFHG
jgi:hypothetical protein